MAPLLAKERHRCHKRSLIRKGPGLRAHVCAVGLSHKASIVQVCLSVLEILSERRGGVGRAPRATPAYYVMRQCPPFFLVPHVARVAQSSLGSGSVATASTRHAARRPYRRDRLAWRAHRVHRVCLQPALCLSSMAEKCSPAGSIAHCTLGH